MRNLILLACLPFLLAVTGCAMPDWLVPRIGRLYSSSDSARQAQQAAFDRSVARSSGSTRNGVRTSMMGSSNYIPGASANPFAP